MSLPKSRNKNYLLYVIFLILMPLFSISLYNIYTQFSRYETLSRSNLEPTAGQQIDIYGRKFAFKIDFLNEVLGIFHPSGLEKSIYFYYKNGDGVKISASPVPNRIWKSDLCIDSEIDINFLKDEMLSLGKILNLKISESCLGKNLFIRRTGSLGYISNRIFCFGGFSCNDVINDKDYYRNGLSIRVAKNGFSELGQPALRPESFKDHIVLFAPDQEDGVEGFVRLSDDHKSIEQSWCLISRMLFSDERKRLISECIIRSLGLFGGDIDLMNISENGDLSIKQDVLNKLKNLYDIRK
jgi:hypothetical protein